MKRMPNLVSNHEIKCVTTWSSFTLPNRKYIKETVREFKESRVPFTRSQDKILQQNIKQSGHEMKNVRKFILALFEVNCYQGMTEQWQWTYRRWLRNDRFKSA